jgi:hypothetical protein
VKSVPVVALPEVEGDLRGAHRATGWPSFMAKTKKSRTAPAAFNPEKFMANEAKKAKPWTGPMIGELLPIGFSKARKRAFIARVLAETPVVRHGGSDVSEATKSLAALKAEIGKEIQTLGIAADPVLVDYLFMDIVCDPSWRRASSRSKNA